MKPSTYCTNRHLRMHTTGNGKQIQMTYYEKTKIYNGVRAANLSELYHLPKLQPESRKSMSKLIQGVLLCDYSSTAAFTKEDLKPSERMQITICHSPYTTQPSTNKSMLRRNIFLPNIRHPFILNHSSVENSSTNSNKYTDRKSVV